MSTQRVEPAEIARVVRRVRKQLAKHGCTVTVKVSDSGSHYINAMKKYSNGIGLGFQIRVSDHPEGNRRRKADLHWHGQVCWRKLLQSIQDSIKAGHVIKPQG